jgi:sulfur carrier protein
MNITVNGEPRTVDPGAVVAALVPDDPAGIAVALNATVVPRAEHATTPLQDGDVVEIVTAVQGG